MNKRIHFGFVKSGAIATHYVAFVSKAEASNCTRIVPSITKLLSKYILDFNASLTLWQLFFFMGANPHNMRLS